MSRFNDGIVHTLDICKNCNKCISECVVPGANVSPSNSQISKVVVDKKKCILCGKCISHCIHNARTYEDDWEIFMNSLKGGQAFSMIVEPSFFEYYGEQAEKILGYLKFLGVQKIYSTAFGAEISLWAHVKYIKDNRYSAGEMKTAFISQNCPAFVNYIVRYKSELRDKIIPVHSPMMCTAVYVKKYLNEENPLVYLSPCIAAKEEMTLEANDGFVTLNLTFDRLKKYIDLTNIDEYSATLDLNSDGVGNYISKAGCLSECVSYYFPRNEMITSYQGINDNTMQMLSFAHKSKLEGTRPLFAEVVSCSQGCLKGPGVDTSKFFETFEQYQLKHKEYFSPEKFSSDWEKNYENLTQQFSQLNYEDFKRKLQHLYKQPAVVPQEIYEEIFTLMLKDTPEKRSINCRMCGYNSCREMAAAIAHSYNKKENCIHYMNDEMVRRYYHDNITELYNRTGFIKEAENMLQAHPKTKFVICAAVINQFKVINDLYGTPVGDLVLKGIGQTLKQKFGDEACICRSGGAQFYLIFKNNFENLNTLHSIKVFDFKHLGIKVPVTMSVGLFVSDSKREPIMNMMNYATLCMDSSVSSFQNTFTMFTSKFRSKMQLDIAITSQMQSAMDNDEFVLYFQPQYHASTGKLVGAESLCRWIKPGGAIISPDIFIPIAEKNGFIRTLDKIIWEKAFSCLRNWLDSGIKPVPISVNISRVSLSSDSLIGVIDRLKKKYSVPLDLIHFEITESAYMDEKENMIRRISKIKELGFMVAMDDFGSGYSTLNSLKDIPIDILKLDMGFLKEDSNLDRGGKIISNIVRMAQSLQLITIAEGVENIDQANFLKSIGCDIIQGFFYARPMPESNFKSLISKEQIQLIVEKPKDTGTLDISSLYDLSSSENYMFENFTGPACIFEFDSATDKIALLRTNERLVKMLGFENHSFIKLRHDLVKHFSKESVKTVVAAIKEASATGKEITRTIEAKSFDFQKVMWLKLYLWKVNSNGDSHSVYVLLEDVSEEKISKSALELASKQISCIAEKTSKGMCQIYISFDETKAFENPKISFMKVDSNFCNFMGLSEKELSKWTEKEIFENIHPDYVEGFTEKFMNALSDENQSTFTYSYLMRLSDGQYGMISVIITLQKYSEGKYMAFMNLMDAD